MSGLVILGLHHFLKYHEEKQTNVPLNSLVATHATAVCVGNNTAELVSTFDIFILLFIKQQCISNVSLHNSINL